MDKLHTEDINGIIMRIKSFKVDNSERNIKLLKGLEKRNAESKLIKELNVNGNIITAQEEILNEQKSFYENLYDYQEQTNSTFNFFMITQFLK